MSLSLSSQNTLPTRADRDAPPHRTFVWDLPLSKRYSNALLSMLDARAACGTISTPRQGTRSETHTGWLVDGQIEFEEFDHDDRSTCACRRERSRRLRNSGTRTTTRTMRITGTGRSTGTTYTGPLLRHAAWSRNPACASSCASSSSSSSSFPNTPLLLPTVGPSHQSSLLDHSISRSATATVVSLCYLISHPVACTYHRIQHSSCLHLVSSRRISLRITHSSSSVLTLRCYIHSASVPAMRYATYILRSTLPRCLPTAIPSVR
ncbi:hypothetical protein K438DRAFT_1811982 [Mycena galopus ATCC 62051]|nr:hypothetical protein K438DRAFT_1811982 [Mycena galopus ATCC 62051]